MKKLLFAMTAATAIAAAAPAAAQYTYQGQGGYQSQADVYAGSAGFANRIAQLQDRLEEGIDTGSIDRTEARSLRLQIRQLERIERQYAVNGLTVQERQDLQQRTRYVRQQLRAAEGQYASSSAYDDEFYDRAAATYPEVAQVCSRRSNTLGSIFGRIFGSDNCLRVGDRLTAGLSTVPSAYRAQFRDGGRYYYRYYEGYVVQVDVRTGVVSRIYEIQA